MTGIIRYRMVTFPLKVTTRHYCFIFREFLLQLISLEWDLPYFYPFDICF